MGNTTSLNSPDTKIKTETFPQRLWGWFIKPSRKITEPYQRRQAALLSTFLLGMIGLALVVPIFYSIPAEQQVDTAFTQIMATVAVFIVITRNGMELAIHGVSREK